MILPPCPHEGCTSKDDHHWHIGDNPVTGACDGADPLCQNLPPKYRCYSRPLRITQEDTPSPAPLMLSLPTVAALVEAARSEGWERGYQAAHDFDDTFFEWVG